MISAEAQKTLEEMHLELKRLADEEIAAFELKNRYDHEWSALCDAEFLNGGSSEDARMRVRATPRGKELDALLTVAYMTEMRTRYNYDLAAYGFRIQLLLVGE